MKLVVVGGVAAGASVVARARRLDEHAEIIMIERGHHVSFANCGLPYHIGDVIKDRERLLVQTPESLKSLLNIDTRVSQEVTQIDRENQTVTVKNLIDGTQYTESYDALALCPGAEPLHIPLPGVDLPQVHVLRRISDMDAIKALVDERIERARQAPKGSSSATVKAVVIGAGYIGLEMAENLHHRGVQVTIVEAAPQILPPVDFEIATPVMNHLRTRGITVHVSTAAAAFRQSGDRVAVELNNNETLDADIVIMSVGVRPATALAKQAGLELGPHGGIKVNEHMQTSDPHIWAAGDVVETPHPVLPGTYLTPLAGPANRQGRVVADNVCGRDSVYRSTQGTSVVKVFDMVVGGTGANERQLQKAQIPYRAAHVHPSGHAGYYPGTAMMNLKVLFDPESGRLLGAQASGFDGVDKRLDVLAMAVRHNMTVFDLEDAELAYAPPFGSAKDPVNMVGFVAANSIRGDIHLWYAQDFPKATEGARIIDVRTPEEYKLWHIPGAENVPIATLRQACGNWDTKVPIRLYCAVGFRSYLGERILRQRGFDDVRTLSGGSNTFRAWHDVELEGAAPQPPAVSYPKADAIQVPPSAGRVIELDCTGLACPGPIMKMSQEVAHLNPGDEISVTVSDPGFAHDGPAWAEANGHTVLSLTPQGAGYHMRLRTGSGPSGVANAVAPHGDGMAFVVFSGDFDKVLAAFIMANGALAMGKPVRMFFTFWGLNVLRRGDVQIDKPMMDKMFCKMMPAGPDALKISQLNMGGAGTAMIKKVMKEHDVTPLPKLIQSAMEAGAEITACTMTMDLLGIRKEELIDGVKLGGVATFIAASSASHATMFI